MAKNTLRFQSNGWKGYVADEEWAQEFGELDRWLIKNPGEVVVRYDCREVRRIATPRGVVYMKIIRGLTDAGYHFRDFFSWCKWVFRGSRAIQAWKAERTLIENGFLCPQPLLAVRRRKGLVPTDLFVTAEVPYPNLWDTPPKGADGNRVAEIVADEIRRLHRAGFAHGDCILRNLCYDTERGRVVYLDNDKTELPASSIRQKRQKRNLAQMTYSLMKRYNNDEIGLHFLEAYAKKAGWPERPEIRKIHAKAIKRRLRRFGR